MGRVRVLPYRQGSKSAKALAEALVGKVLRLQGSKFVAKPDDLVINWGNTHTYYAFDCPVINDGDLKAASNKLKFFTLMKDREPGIIPEFWTNKQDIPETAYPVVCRTVLAGHSGEGIVIADSPDQLVDAPLYVKYVKKKEEYRVHVGKAEGAETIIAVQRKARRLSVPDEEVNWKVRNLAGGFVFTREGFTLPSACEEVSRRCLRATGLDFGAVDVIWNEHENKAYVLEVNTAPGLEGQTVENYANFFKGLM